jgi:uncharacterized protein (TIGR03067 family)
MPENGSPSTTDKPLLAIARPDRVSSGGYGGPTRLLVPLFTVTLFAPIAGSAPRLKEKDPPPIVGEWLAESRTFGGQSVGLPQNGLRLIIRADGTYTWIVGEVDPDPDGHTYKLNQKAGLEEIDMASLGKPTYLCIFKIEKEILTLCFGQRGDPRPAAFESPSGSRTDLYVFKRVAKK